MEIYMNELSTESPYELEKDIIFIKEIGHGAFGDVIHAYDTKKNLDLAIKVVNKVGAGIDLIKEMKEEISILKKINHDNIVKFYGYSETNNQLLIKMEYIKYGTLTNWMKSHPNITEEKASLIISKVLSAVEYLHSMQICHRDIKPDNIMISKESDLSSIKIIDFGLSAQQFNYLTKNEYCGTILYMAPEQIEKKLYHFSVDIWSVGILMYMLLNNGKHPFYQKNIKKKDFLKKIKSGKLNFINKLSFMAQNLIYKLCEPNPSWRYSANLAIKHPWITRNTNDEIPVTFNEILNLNNSKKNANYLMMISIFLNYYKKKEIKKGIIKNNNIYYFDTFIKKKKNKNKIYIINQEYINKCNIVSKRKKEKLLKIRETCLEILSSEEEEEKETSDKKETINNYKLSFKKNENFSEKIITPRKNNNVNNAYESNLEILKNNLFKNSNIKFNKNNLILNNKEENIFQINRKSTLKDKSKLYLSSIPANQYKHQKSDEIKSNSKIKNTLNNYQINSTNRTSAKSKSITKFLFSKNNSKEEANDEKEICGECKYELTPEKSSNQINKQTNKSNLPYMVGFGKHIKNNAIITNKKYHNNFIWNYNIIPLVLPTIGSKQEDKKSIII